MVGHQAVCIKEEREFLFLQRQQRQELFIVCGRIEYRPAIIATSDDVIKTTFNFGASLTGHGTRMLVVVDSPVNAP